MAKNKIKKIYIYKNHPQTVEMTKNVNWDMTKTLLKWSMFL